MAKEGEKVQAGEAIFYEKGDERILFPSPVSGKITEIVRGAKRRILTMKILSDGKQIFKNFIFFGLKFI